ncbi:hypothetical protein [Desulforhabdus sp. TSK]|uniref:hypothetical protein n=1 Tax=Desulforhabdus sp. TSK TaxID=2925014 RepID=UPI001FC89C59|nr:hypothetical protein [Desulforhabdus sp. TSK]
MRGEAHIDSGHRRTAGRMEGERASSSKVMSGSGSRLQDVPSGLFVNPDQEAS